MIYTYHCKKCDVTEDRLVTSKTAEFQFCNKCDNKEPMELIPTFSTSISFKGDWFKNKGHY